MAPRCVFLDRDGVINKKLPEGQWVTQWDQFELIPQAVDWIRIFNYLGWLVIVITNQRSVSLGLITEEQLRKLHEQMVETLATYGARVSGIFVCPHAENVCDCRKPKPGLIHQAVQSFDIDLDNAVFIGDSDCDEELAAGLKLPFLRVKDGQLVKAVPTYE